MQALRTSVPCLRVCMCCLPSGLATGAAAAAPNAGGGSSSSWRWRQADNGGGRGSCCWRRSRPARCDSVYRAGAAAKGVDRW